MSDENKRTFEYFFFRLKRIAQLALQELNLSSKVNFNLALLDIITNKTSGENAMSDKYCFQSYASKHFALIPCVGLYGSTVLLFFVFSFDLFSVYVIIRERQSLI